MIAALLGLLCAGCLFAVPESAHPVDASPAEPADQQQIKRKILEEELDRETRVVSLARARISFPQQVSAAIGLMVTTQPRSYDCTTVCEFRGFLLEAEPGITGGQLSAGYAVIMGETGRTGSFVSDIYLAYGIKGALLRTWGDADLRPADQTLIGVEGDFTVIQVNFSLGLFRHVGSGNPEDDWIVTGGIGWGF